MTHIAESTAPKNILHDHGTGVIYGADADVFSAASVEETWQVAQAEPVCGFCRDCKWWKLECCRLTGSNLGRPNFPWSTAVAYDQADGIAFQLTKPNHACNQHRPKDSNDLP